LYTGFSISLKSVEPFIYTLFKVIILSKITSGPLDIAARQTQFILMPWFKVDNALHAGDSEMSIIMGKFACISGMQMLIMPISLFRHNSLYPVTFYNRIWEVSGSNFSRNTG
jgi:hypothetical protein